MKKYFFILFLFLTYIDLRAQNADCHKLYIVDFVDDNNIKNEYTRSLTTAVEEALIDVRECSVLQRTKSGTLNAQIANEEAFQSTRGMKATIKKALSTLGAEQVLFGELRKTGPGEYQLEVRIENLATTQIMRLKTAAFTVNDLESIKREKAIVSEMITVLLDKSFAPEPIPHTEPKIHNVDNGLDFLITDCIGDQGAETVTIYFTFANPRKSHQEITVWLGYNGLPLAYAFDDDGNQFPCKSVMLANEKGTYVSRELPTGLKIKGSITYSNVLPQTTHLSLAKINIRTKDFDGGANEKTGAIEIRNLKINW